MDLAMPSFFLASEICCQDLSIVGFIRKSERLPGGHSAFTQICPTRSIVNDQLLIPRTTPPRQCQPDRTRTFRIPIVSALKPLDFGHIRYRATNSPPRANRAARQAEASRGLQTGCIALRSIARAPWRNPRALNYDSAVLQLIFTEELSASFTNATKQLSSALSPFPDSAMGV